MPLVRINFDPTHTVQRTTSDYSAFTLNLSPSTERQSIDMASEIPNEHRKRAPRVVNVSILTVSDTRTLENDLGGQLIADLLIAVGHSVVNRQIVPDELEQIRTIARREIESEACEALLVTGGTGLAARDCTTEAIEPLYDASIPGYGEIFRWLSYQEIGPAAMLSRASGGRVGKKVVLTMPGSPAGVRLAMEKLIVPELAHFVLHAGK